MLLSATPLSVIMLGVTILSRLMLCATILSVILHSVTVQIVITLSVILVNVVAPTQRLLIPRPQPCRRIVTFKPSLQQRFMDK